MTMDVQTHIPSYNITIEPEDLDELQADLWSDDPVMAYLEINRNVYDIDIVYRGSHIRKFPKKSYQCFLGRGREFHLNSEYKDPSLMRNKLSMDFFSDIGVHAPKTQHVRLYINKIYQGVYLRLESVNRQFLKARNLTLGQIWYAEDDDANFSLISPLDERIKETFEAGYSRKVGTREDDAYLSELIYKINTIPKSSFGSEVTKILNVEKYLRWLAGVVCTQNFDGFIHNYALYRPRDTGLFEVLPWDYDATWGRDIHGRVMEYDFIPIQGFNTLTARLLDDNNHRKRYQNILKQILNNQFTTHYLESPISTMHSRLRPYVMKDPYIQNNLQKYDGEPEVMLQYIEQRSRYLRKHLSDLD